MTAMSKHARTTLRFTLAALSTRYASALAAGLAGLAYAATAISGVPVLRQDWGDWPFDTTWRAVLGAWSGWSTSGIGNAQPYPAAYLLTLPIAASLAMGGHRFAALLFLACTGLLCAFGARALAKDAGCGEVGAAAAALFAVLNPWAYTELIAGHEFMLLAYAGSIWLVRELLRESPRPIVLGVFALLTAQQLQFFVISSAALAVVAIRSRMWRPLAIVVVVWIPVVYGMIAERHMLASIPLLLAWERSQSVTLADALQLNGYFAHYADAFRGFYACAALDTLSLALFAAVLPPYARKRTMLAAMTLLAIVLATGARGPIAGVYDWALLHVHAVGLYRELYDLLAYAAIGYLALAAVLCARVRPLQWLWLAGTALLALVWIIAPPSRFWVRAWQVPRVAVPAGRNVRFALLPAFQPMSYLGRGSGADPNVAARSNNVSSLNQYNPTYPADAALAVFEQSGDVRPLEALSVGSIIVRPWLRTERTALASQWPLPVPSRRAHAAQTILLRPAPELALLPMPDIGALDTRVGSGNVFFGDAAKVRGPLVPAQWKQLPAIVPIAQPTIQRSAREGWVDARLAFAERPDLAQAFGGALTTDPRALLPIRDDLSALVFVDGALLASDGHVVTRTTHGYRWVRIPAGTRAVRCNGLCVVAAQGDPPRSPLEPPPRTAQAVDFRLVFPWLAVAMLPPGPQGTVRYNVTYDGGWRAYLGGARLTHLRIDAAVNGWLVPARSRAQRLFIFEAPAAVEFVLELLAALTVAAVGARLLQQAARR